MLRGFVAVGVLVAALAVGAGAAPAPGCACDCAMASNAEKLHYADAVFVGTAREVRAPSPLADNSRPTLISFTVTRVYKGHVHRTTSVGTAAIGGGCGAEFTEGTRYLVYAESASDAPWSTAGVSLMATLCGGSRAVSSGGPVGVGARGRPVADGGRGLPPESVSPQAVGLIGAGTAVLLLALPITLWWRGRRRFAGPR
ncbi:MAG: hypothetical protein WCA46_20285 [Actinocatenispora sp.]